MTRPGTTVRDAVAFPPVFRADPVFRLMQSIIFTVRLSDGFRPNSPPETTLEPALNVAGHVVIGDVLAWRGIHRNECAAAPATCSGF